MRITLEGDDRQTLIARLGLSSDASDADINAAVATRLLAAAPEPAPGPAPNPAPDPNLDPAPDPNPADDPADDPDDDAEGIERVDAAAYRALVARANRSEQIEEEARIATRDRLVEDAIKAGKFPPSRRDHYRTRYDTDAVATKRDIDRMAKNVVPLKDRGKDVSEEDLQANSDQYDPAWVPELAQRQQAAAAAANGGGGRPSRIHSED